MRFPPGPALLLLLLLVPGLPAEPVASPAGPALSAGPASSPPAVPASSASSLPAVPASAVGAPPSAAPVPSAALPPPAGPVPSAALPPATNAARFRWPLPGPPRLARRFDPPPEPWLPGHRGVDLAAEPGAAVHAAGGGTVLFAGPVAGRPVVTVGHGDGLRTTYEPVRSRLAAGDRIDAGTPVGDLLTGHPGCPVVACLHWGLRRGDDYLDPLSLLGLGRARLLPLDPDDRAQPWASNAGSRAASRSYSSGLL
ncbi:peptidoglycan DD-metalloendopeptidase family protein [Micromonospora sp. WMMD998]|uniref:peptidoglycan DD-metalloendopeptidase family protein n=1 Tax=Micromonospora sp. WMMD998 TaxID=3016092 RepID=UPI002499C7B2|nr:peptidoglycan DD-metalloendopeptidase family protein [Micromonospora sp. WMMD998]WFE38928.1 peptidoglycan DD-metalloendopeptidase family protein [Micromonospora sp. WMMD998]